MSSDKNTIVMCVGWNTAPRLDWDQAMLPAKTAATDKTQKKYNEEREHKAYSTEGIAEVQDFNMFVYNTATDEESVSVPADGAGPPGVQLFDAITAAAPSGFYGSGRVLLFAFDAHDMLHITLMEALRAGRTVPVRYHFKPKGVWDPYHALLRATARQHYSNDQLLIDLGIATADDVQREAGRPDTAAYWVAKLVRAGNLEELVHEPSQFQEA